MYTITQLHDAHRIGTCKRLLVTVMHNNSWWLVCILAIYQESGEVKLKFLFSNRPAPLFYYPIPTPDKLDEITEILFQKAELRTATRRAHVPTKKEMEATSLGLGKKTPKS